jgi:hypothetical protein
MTPIRHHNTISIHTATGPMRKAANEVIYIAARNPIAITQANIMNEHNIIATVNSTSCMERDRELQESSDLTVIIARDFFVGKTR